MTDWRRRRLCGRLLLLESPQRLPLSGPIKIVVVKRSAVFTDGKSSVRGETDKIQITKRPNGEMFLTGVAVPDLDFAIALSTDDAAAFPFSLALSVRSKNFTITRMSRSLRRWTTTLNR